MDLEGIRLNEVRWRKANTIWFHSYAVDKETNSSTIRTQQWLREGKEDSWTKWVTHTVKDMNWTFSGEHRVLIYNDACLKHLCCYEAIWLQYLKKKIKVK